MNTVEYRTVTAFGTNAVTVRYSKVFNVRLLFICRQLGQDTINRFDTEKHENIVYSIPDSIQVRVTLGLSAKRHSMAFRWQADSGPLPYGYLDGTMSYLFVCGS